jgi:hypothetical protein
MIEWKMASDHGGSTSGDFIKRYCNQESEYAELFGHELVMDKLIINEQTRSPQRRRFCEETSIKGRQDGLGADDYLANGLQTEFTLPLWTDSMMVAQVARRRSQTASSPSAKATTKRG